MHSAPRLVFLYLVAELVGSTQDTSDFVYFSDGGHFDNLGLYELVRRRCKVCDAGCDSSSACRDLCLAIEKCRVDFGVDIRIPKEQLMLVARDASGISAKHFAKGTIHYNREYKGTLIYLKASRTGDEPADIQSYVRASAAFPHESTAD